MCATIKQIKAFKEVGENGGIISKAMETVGYAKSITHATEKLTNSKGWQELMEKHIPDSLLAKKHKEGLDATEDIMVGGELVKKTDYSVRHKYLDSAYKLKGRYVKDENELPNQTINLIGITINNPQNKDGHQIELKSNS